MTPLDITIMTRSHLTHWITYPMILALAFVGLIVGVIIGGIIYMRHSKFYVWATPFIGALLGASLAFPITSHYARTSPSVHTSKLITWTASKGSVFQSVKQHYGYTLVSLDYDSDPSHTDNFELSSHANYPVSLQRGNKKMNATLTVTSAADHTGQRIKIVDAHGHELPLLK